MILECPCNNPEPKSICSVCVMKLNKPNCVFCCPDYDKHYEVRFATKGRSVSR